MRVSGNLFGSRGRMRTAADVASWPLYGGSGGAVKSLGVNGLHVAGLGQVSGPIRIAGVNSEYSAADPAVTPGAVYTAFAIARLGVDQAARLEMEFTDGSLVTQQVVTSEESNVKGWNTFKVEAVAPEDAAYVHIDFGVRNANPADFDIRELGVRRGGRWGFRTISHLVRKIA